MQLTSVLPEEILLEIFSEIDKSSLQSFLEISLEWRELLIRNAKVMRKLPLILMNDTWLEKLKFVENYGKFIREIEFIDTKLESFDDVLKVLRLTPNVEKISLINVKLPEKENAESEENVEENAEENAEDISERQKLFMGKLKKIVVEDLEIVGSLQFLIDNCEVELSSLKCDLNDNTQMKTLQQILVENSQLKSLEITTQLEEVFNPSDEMIEQFNFQLTSFTIESSLLRHDVQLMKFLRSQKHFKELSFKSDFVDSRYNQMMFTTFPTLKRIQLNIDTLATTECLAKLRRTPPNKSIESLTVFGENIHLNVFDAVLKLCPKIHRLNVQNLTHFHCDKIHSMPLTHLRVDRLNHEHLRAEKLRQSMRVQLGDIVHSQPKEVYERNLQCFCDMNRYGDRSKDADVD